MKTLNVASTLRDHFDTRLIKTLPDLANNGSSATPESLCLSPTSEAEWIQAMQLAQREDWKLCVRGQGSKWNWRQPQGTPDLVLSTEKYQGVLRYEPDDGTLSARAGTTWQALTEQVHQNSQHLAPDIAHPSTSSLGGVLATAQSGVDRMRYGPARHQVLGMSVLGANGVTTKSGGQLVKNVTGYDVHRLHCGAFGRLGIILEVSLRLAPLQQDDAWLEITHCNDLDKAWQLALQQDHQPGCLRGVFLHQHNERVGLTAHLSGIQAAVDAQLESLLPAFQTLRASTSAEPLRGNSARTAAQHARDHQVGGSDERVDGSDSVHPDIELFDLPHQLPKTLAVLQLQAQRSELSCSWSADVGVGRAQVALRPQHEDRPQDRELFLAAQVPKWRAEMRSRGGRIFLRNASTALRRQVGAREDLNPDASNADSSHPARALATALQDTLDPQGRFELGQ